MANTPFQLDMSPVTTGDLNLTPGLTKVETLAQNKASKLERLGEQAQNKSLLAGTHTVMDSGTIESNANKIWNELTPEELQYVTGYATGKYYNPELDSTEARRFYTYGTKDDNTKVGLSTGKAPTSDVRYSKEEALKAGLRPDDWRTSGPTGPDLENKLIDTPMDFAAATALEGLYHGNKRLLGERKYPDYLSEEALKAGSGVSEYYKGGAENVFGESYKNLSDERTKELESYFDQMMDLPGAKATKVKRGYRSFADIQGTSGDADGMIGESVDIAQSSLMQQWGKIGKSVAKMGRWVGESLGVDPETMKEIMPDRSGLFGKKFSELSNQKVADKMTGVMAKTREEQQAGMQEALKGIEEGNYGKAAWESVKILPYMLGDSAGEMAAIISGTPGIALAVSARVSEDSEEYEKNNGTKPDAQWMLGSTLLNAGALLGEKFLVKTGISGVIEKGVSKAARTGGVVTSAVGEATQEYFDQVQQTYMTQKEGESTLGDIATSPEAQLGAIAGGTMGGALRGAGEVTGAAFDKAKPVVGKAAGKIADEIERRQNLKAEEEAAIAEAEAEDAPVTLTTKYGNEEAVRTKETEYKTTIDEAIEKGDTYAAVLALKAYSDDVKADTEGLLDKNEITSRKAKLQEMVAAEEAKIAQGEATTEQAQTFGSSPEMVDAIMEEKTAEEAEKFLQTYSTNYGSDVDTTRVQQHVVAKKALEEVGEEVANDIKAKINAIKNATTDTERSKALADFERFKADRISRNSKLTNWVAGLEQDLRAEAETHEDPEAYLRELAKSTDTVTGKVNSDHKYKAKGIHTTENYAYRSDIAKRLLDEGHNRGVYNVLSKKEAELAAFNSQSELLTPTKEEVPTEEVIKPTEKVDSKVDKILPSEEIVEEAVAEPTQFHPDGTPDIEEAVFEEMQAEEAKATKGKVIADIAKLVKAGKFKEARAATEASPLSKDAKQKVFDRIDAQEKPTAEKEIEVVIKPRTIKDSMSPGEKITVETFNTYKDKPAKAISARHNQLLGKVDALSKQAYSEETERKLGLVHNDIQALEDIMTQRNIAFNAYVPGPSQSELDRLESLKESVKEDVANGDRESEVIHRLHIAAIEAAIDGAKDSMFRVGEIDSALSDKEIQERLRSVKRSMTNEAFESYRKGLRAGKDAEKSTKKDTKESTINIYAGTNENAELSNFANRPFTDDGILDLGNAYNEATGNTITWNTVEGAFQAEKIFYSDSEKYWSDAGLTPEAINLIEKFAKVDGKTAKAMGRKIEGLNTARWDAAAEAAMDTYIFHSFDQNPEAVQALLATGKAELTHKQDKSRWGKKFPELLMKNRALFEQDKELYTEKSTKEVSLDDKNKTLLIPIEKVDGINNPLVKDELDNEFTPKKEFHLTVLGFPQGKEIKGILEDNPELAEKIQELIDNADFSYNPTDDFYTISRDREAWIDWQDQSKGKETIHEEAIIQLIEAPGVETFINDLNKLLGTDFPVPFAHISLATKGTPMGIGIANEAAFKGLNPVKLGSVAEPEGPTNKATTIETKPVKEPTKVEETPTDILPTMDYGSDFLEILRAELENDLVEEAELKASLDKSREAIDGFNEVIDQYEKDLQNINSQKAAIRRKIGKHKEEIRKYKSKIGRASHKKKLTSSYFNQGLRELNSAKKIATAAINMIKGMVDSIKRFQKLITKHEAVIEGYNQDMLQLRIREEAIEDAKKETRVKKAKARKQRAEDIEQIQGVQESIKASEKELQNFVTKEVIRNSSMPVLSKVIFTEKKTTSKLSFDPNAGNQLSAILANLNERLSAENITKIINEKFNTKGIKYVAEKTIESDPARVLFDKDGNLHPNVVAAMSKSLVEYLLKYGTNFIAQDPKQIAQMLGYGDNVESMPGDALGLVGNKTFKKNVADALGKGIMNDLGLKVDKEADAVITKKYGKTRAKDTTGIEEKIIASLGQMAAIIGGEIGIFTKVDEIDSENRLSAEQYARIANGVVFQEGVEHTGIDMIGIGDLGRKFITSKDMYTTMNKINEDFAEGSYLKEVRTSPVKTDEVKQKVPVEVFEPSEFNKKTINNARKQAWRMDFAALDIFKDNKELIKKHLGYVNTTTVTDKDGSKKETIPALSYVDEQNQLAKNNSIDLKLTLLENLQERIQEQGEDTDLFFEYFYGSNGRYYLDNNEANPQNDKFNRFMLGLASNKVEVDLSKEGDSATTFYVALAQAFGEDVDKMSTEKSVEAGKAWLDKGSDTILKEFKEEAFKPEEVGHALQGILAVQAFENSNGKPFETNLVIETDAVTSGIILKLLQLPVMGLEKARNLLRKGGIVFKGDQFYDDFKGTNKLIEDGELDLYRELALNYGQNIELFLSSGAWKIQPKEGTELTKGQEFINKRRGNLLKAATDGGIMPEFTTDPDKIHGNLRKIFKPVVMVFGYGGGVASIKQKFVSEIIETLPTKLLAEMTAAQKALKAGKPKPPMPVLDFFKVIAPDQKFTVSMLRSKDILDRIVYKDKTIRDLMVQDMTALYGDLLERSLSDIFGPELVEANKKLNNSFRMMFRIFDHKYKKELEAFESAHKRKPTADEKAEIILDLKDSFPAVAPPFAKDSNKGIIIDTKTAAASRIKAQTMGNFSRDGGQQSLSVQAVVKEFEEAISSGNVVPIHYVDASIIGTTFNNIDGVTQVFDALVTNMNNAVTANKEYNKNTYEISKNYSLAEKVLESLDQSIDTMTTEEKKLFLDKSVEGDEAFAIAEGQESFLSFEDVRHEMNGLKNRAIALRQELFSVDAKVDHMTGLEAIAEFTGDTKPVTEKPSAENKQQTALDADIRQYGEDIEPAVMTGDSIQNIDIYTKGMPDVDLGRTDKRGDKEFKEWFESSDFIAEMRTVFGEDVFDYAFDSLPQDPDSLDWWHLVQKSVKDMPASKEKNGILPSNKKLSRATNSVINKECK